MANSKAFKRIRVALTHFAVGIVGMIVGFGLYCWIRVYTAQWRSTSKWYSATLAEKSGNDDKAIILLSQATIEDPNSHIPWELLGQIYSRKGNRQLALELYGIALNVLGRDKEYNSLPARDREQIRNMLRKNIDALQIQLKDKKDRPQDQSSPAAASS